MRSSWTGASTEWALTNTLRGMGEIVSNLESRKYRAPCRRGGHDRLRLHAEARHDLRLGFDPVLQLVAWRESALFRLVIGAFTLFRDQLARRAGLCVRRASGHRLRHADTGASPMPE